MAETPSGWNMLTFIFLGIAVGSLSGMAYWWWRYNRDRLDETVPIEESTTFEGKWDAFNALATVAQVMSDGVLVTDENGDIIWANQAFEIARNATFKEFIAKKGLNFFEHDAAPEVVQRFKDAKAGIVVRYEWNYTSHLGERKWNLVKINPLVVESGEIEKFIIIFTDITDQKLTEEKLFDKHQSVTDSIIYAKQIQEAILPERSKFFKAFPESFIYYVPKDIVSGDFYWFSKIGEVMIVVTADCTGHGVPGAMMSLMGNEFLHQIVNSQYTIGPDQALRNLDEMIKRALHQHGNVRESKDGIDLGMLAVHTKTLFCQYAGAQIPLYHIRDGVLTEYEGAKESVGGYSNSEKLFYSHEFDLKVGDCLYMSSDGYIDQFGGPRGKKFYRKNFKKLLADMSGENMTIQQVRLSKTFQEWKGDLRQVDDVLVMGMRIPRW